MDSDFRRRGPKVKPKESSSGQSVLGSYQHAEDGVPIDSKSLHKVAETPKGDVIQDVASAKPRASQPIVEATPKPLIEEAVRSGETVSSSSTPVESAVRSHPGLALRRPGPSSRIQGGVGDEQPLTAASVVGQAAASMDEVSDGAQKRPRMSKWKLVLGAIAGLVVIALIALFAGYKWWYQAGLKAVGSDLHQSVKFTVAEGASSGQVATSLYEEGLIRDESVFKLYYRLESSGEGIKAGLYSLSSSMSTPEIITKLEKGEVDSGEMQITFLPGGTIFDAKDVLVKAGFSEAEAEAAINAEYTSPILASKPADVSIEGYIFGETYSFFLDATAEEVIARAIKQLEDYVIANDVEARFASQGLTLHEGLALASLVQTEVRSEDEMRQVASVFHNRLAIDMELGSDVTFRYAAKMLDQEVAIEIDSPYNTRTNKGLPPGPVAAPGVAAIEATLNPDDTEYLFFVSGDDGVTYFSKTNAEHERLTREHCDVNCRVQM